MRSRLLALFSLIAAAALLLASMAGLPTVSAQTVATVVFQNSATT